MPHVAAGWERQGCNPRCKPSQEIVFASVMTKKNENKGEDEEQEQAQKVEPQLVPLSGPMAEFDETAVQSWLAAVPGLTAAQRAAAAEMMAEDEYEGAELVGATAKTLRRL